MDATKTVANHESVPISLVLVNEQATQFRWLWKKWGLSNKTEIVRKALKEAYDRECEKGE